MDNKLSLKILDSNIEVNKLRENINDKMADFVTKANELVDESDDDYQIEKTIKLNKISLKGFVLDSDCCITLKDNKIRNYSIVELKSYLNQYEKQFNEDYSKYFLALSLYELLEEIESYVDKQIDIEMQIFTELIPNIKDITETSLSEYEPLYINLKSQLDRCLSANIIDEKVFWISNQMLNDIFNFYISGYPDIPEEYLYQDGT